MNVGIIGAGVGGLATACLLANEGHEVTVFEKNDKPGGKLNQVVHDGYTFDTGPSLLTMPYIIEQLFAICHKDIDDYLKIEPLDLLCRYFYPDGTIFNCYADDEKTISGIKKFAPGDAEAYSRFLDYAQKLYDRTTTAFLLNPLNKWTDLLGLRYLDLLRIDSFTTVSNRIDSFFKSDYLRQFFKRFTTYNGSSPFKAPATLNVIPHIELNMGSYYIHGGMYQLTKALYDLSIDLDVIFHFNTEIQSIDTDRNNVNHLINSKGKKFDFDVTVSNADSIETYLKLLPDRSLPNKKKRKLEQLEPSSSGFVLLLGCNKTFESLSHHNIFFSSDYEKEFHQIFEEHIPPEEPTIYVTDVSKSDPGLSPAGHSTLFVLVNVPHLNGTIDWDKQKGKYASKIITILENRGLENLDRFIEFKEMITPMDFYTSYRSNKGSIYGISSNDKRTAFIRPRNKSPYIKNLYLVGGSTHPGGGIPLVILSAFHAWQSILRDHPEKE